VEISEPAVLVDVMVVDFASTPRWCMIEYHVGDVEWDFQFGELGLEQVTDYMKEKIIDTRCPAKFILQIVTADLDMPSSSPTNT
jgi:hypothetical protein